MKVKCPFCNFEESDRITMQVHFKMEHDSQALLYLADKLFKIHENIEEIGNKKPPLPTTLHNRTEFHRNMGALQALKSLLENDKK